MEPWHEEGANSVRSVRFRAPLDALKGSFRLPGIPKTTRIVDEQRCAFLDCAGAEGEPQRVLVDSTTAQLDIPYGDAFRLESRLELRAQGEPGAPPRCRATVHFHVRWLHPPRFSAIKHKIENQSTGSIGDAYRMCVRATLRFAHQIVHSA